MQHRKSEATEKGKGGGGGGEIGGNEGDRGGSGRKLRRQRQRRRGEWKELAAAGKVNVAEEGEVEIGGRSRGGRKR